MNWNLVIVVFTGAAEIAALVFRLLRRKRYAGFSLATSAVPWLVCVEVALLDNWRSDLLGVASFILFPAVIIMFGMRSLREPSRLVFWFGWSLHISAILLFWLLFVHWDITA